MIADFQKTFKDQHQSAIEISPEVLEILSQELPDNFEYYFDQEAGEYIAGPKEGVTSIKISFDIADEAIKAELSEIPREDWAKYIYRSQMIIPTKNAMIGDDNSQVPIEKLHSDPLGRDNDIRIEKACLYPAPFPPEKVFIISTAEGDRVRISFRQQKHPSLSEIKISNTNFPALKLDMYISEETLKTRINFNVSPRKASTVDEAIAAIHMIKGMFDGTIMMNGKPMFPGENHNEEFDQDQYDEMIKLWSTIKQVEKKLKVSFNPSAPFPTEDVRTMIQLGISLVGKEPAIQSAPFSHFHMDGVSVSAGSFDDCIGKKLQCDFNEGPFNRTLLGADISFYSKTSLKNVVISEIDWEDEDKTSGEVYIEMASDPKWTLERVFYTEEEFASLGNTVGESSILILDDLESSSIEE